MVIAAEPSRGRACLVTLLAVTIACAAFAYFAVSLPAVDPSEFRSKYGPTALIAGASEGLGAAWAEYCAASGINLVLVARRAKPLEAIATRLRASYGVTVQTRVFDLGNSTLAAFGKAIFEDARNDIGLLIYNAAYTGSSAGIFTEDSLAMALTAVDVNVRGPLSLVHPFLTARQRRRAPGGVVLMSSMAGLVGSAYISNYAATKAWNTAFATGLFDEWRKRHVDVLACVAGATTTPSYLSHALASRSRAIEQSPSAVVSECAAALGHAPTRATGMVNRLGELALGRLLPRRVAVHVMSDGARSTTRFEHVLPPPARGRLSDLATARGRAT